MTGGGLRASLNFMSESPLRRLREEASLTIDKVAHRTGLSKQYIIKAEQACYAEPSDALLRFYETNFKDVAKEYYTFQREVRKQNFGKLIEPWHFHLGELEDHPFINWRVCSGVGSRDAISRFYCVHPAIMYKFEMCKITTVPEHLVTALLESGYDAVTLTKLEEAYQAYLQQRREGISVVTD